MNITEIKNRVHEHAVKIGAYDCHCCKSERDRIKKLPENARQIDRFYHCDRCDSSGELTEENIIAKLKEEVSEFESAVKENRIAPNHPLKTSASFQLNEKNHFISEWKSHFEAYIKNTKGDELADIIITALAGAKELNIDIESHILAKLKFNEVRGDHEINKNNY